MFNARLENQLIVPEIADAMQDYTSIQLDIDDTKIKAAALAAQKLDIARVIGRENIIRCVELETEADEELRELIIPALCYYTYSRSLKMFQGTLTDSGYATEAEAESRNLAKSVANEMDSVAEVFLKDVIEFLALENPEQEEEQKQKLTPSIRVVGGREHWSNNY